MTDNSMSQSVPQQIPTPDDAITGTNTPTVIHGVALLVIAAVVALWRLVDHPDWALLGVWLAAGAGAAFLVLAGLSVAVSRWRRDQEFERRLAETRDPH
ncbi:hypothetical protein HJ588_12290 [Flexivirga sp. ID2601S]|uniref:DUF2530 domain-containing protein n=1 Tax=Flexivirga aerilata TaxID=1656889 RepID=A0A849AL29_9MICO|nr:hypothetical protein [Flexivirga aerilata]NNG40041.1 hypothetical protein [Flexivirga aerilata]